MRGCSGGCRDDSLIWTSLAETNASGWDWGGKRIRNACCPTARALPKYGKNPFWRREVAERDWSFLICGGGGGDGGERCEA